MIIVNFSHPLTGEQRAEIEARSGERVDRVIEVPTHFDDALPFADQVAALVSRAGLTAEEWQTLPMVVNPPSFGPIVAVLLAYIHGLCGYFPTLIRLRPVPDAPVPRFELAEIMGLDQLRRHARDRRDEPSS